MQEKAQARFMKRFSLIGFGGKDERKGIANG
jgi:hypothetical protein